jgi:hypothetical protein
MNKKRGFTVRYEKPVARKAAMKSFGPDEKAQAGDFKPGDFILTHGNSCFSRVIRVGQGLVFWGGKRKYTWWSHAALIVSKEGDLIEATGHGVSEAKLEKYAPTEYTVVRVDDDLASSEDRDEIVAYGKWARGQTYGYLTIVSIAVNLLFGGSVSFFVDGQSICSGLVARALERSRVIFDRSPSHIMPADLAFYFDVEPPPKGTSKGVIPS